jgi:hypothetical protein
MLKRADIRKAVGALLFFEPPTRRGCAGGKTQ